MAKLIKIAKSYINPDHVIRLQAIDQNSTLIVMTNDTAMAMCGTVDQEEPIAQATQHHMQCAIPIDEVARLLNDGRIELLQ